MTAEDQDEYDWLVQRAHIFQSWASYIQDQLEDLEERASFDRLGGLISQVQAVAVAMDPVRAAELMIGERQPPDSDYLYPRLSQTDLATLLYAIHYTTQHDPSLRSGERENLGAMWKRLRANDEQLPQRHAPAGIV